MKVVVNDANILIDLVKLQLLPHFFALAWEFHTTSLVLDELYDSQQEAYAAYIDNKRLTIDDLDGDELSVLLDFRTEKPQLSEQDCSAVLLSMKTDGLLISSDKNLREFAKAKGLEVHGHLWLFDQMVDSNTITPLRAAEKLDELKHFVNPRLHLPEVECQKRINLWKDGSL
jgi:predicted nucleic acid-binding protein